MQATRRRRDVGHDRSEGESKFVFGCSVVSSAWGSEQQRTEGERIRCQGNKLEATRVEVLEGGEGERNARANLEVPER